MDYYGALGPTVKKIIGTAALTPIIYIGGVMLGLGATDASLLLLGFFVGMIFPDLDVFTGWIRTTFQTMLLIIFLAAGIMVYPIAWGIIGNACPVGLVKGISSGLDAAVVCKLALAVLIGLAAYILAWLAVSWLPARNSFHGWGTAAMLAGGMGLLNRAIAIAANPWPITIGFGLGYIMHILLDGKKTVDGESVIAPLPKNAPPIMKHLRF